MTFSNLPIDDITTGSSEYPDLTSVVGPPTPDVVSPSAANQQPDQLSTRTLTLHDRVVKIIVTLNELSDEVLQRSGSTAGSAMKGDLDMTDPATAMAYRVINCADATGTQDAVTLGQLNALSATLSDLQSTLAGALLRDGSLAMTGNLDGGGNRATNFADPSGNQDAATKNYVDSLSSNVSNEYLKRDGSNAMLSNLDMGSNRIINAANPTSSTDAVTKGWMDAQLQGIGTAPAGSLAYYAGINSPAGWLFCDGDTYNQTQYTGLYSVIGDTFNGTNTATDAFRVPDLRGRYLVGVDAGANRITRNALSDVGDTDGAEYVSLISTELPSHKHTYSDKYALYNGTSSDTGPTGSTSGFYINDDTTATSDSTGSGAEHENCPPTMALNILIKT
jgi:microcystin-dependent protein